MSPESRTTQNRPAGTAFLTSPAFLLAVALLLLNDWVLKPAIGSWWTGKLSDFAGIFAIAIFWSALVGHRNVVHALTATGFLAWKSPMSEPIIIAWNSLNLLPIARVVDYTDWIALVALVPAYRITSTPQVVRSSFFRRFGAVVVGVVAIFAFTATSVVRPHPIPHTPSYTLPGNAAAVRVALDSLGFEPYLYRGNATDGIDTLGLHVRHPPERWVSIVVEVRDARADSAMLRLVATTSWEYARPPGAEKLFRAFETQVVEPLRVWLASRPPASNDSLAAPRRPH